ncbi:hybrid sensor histidine kinase/response regulator [Pedobacter frigoris]|uniref:histidine kinase n=1 Tax=Pedobacter frigoris TaxID=2571272 RepID=A0A4U1CGM0_9SPHI|nr:ATP-binding protein [Pedobacter frigoris]TKC04256.1 response regulator [Pedobacter frigoris]
MSNVPRKSFISSIKGKVIISLLLACFALFMAWGVSRVAFKEMLNTVEHISAPSERLRIVNVTSRRIGSLDQLQKKQAFNDPRNYAKLFKQSKDLRMTLDSLALLYSGDSLQLDRIHKIKRLLSQRDKQFINYLTVRERLVNNSVFSEQVQNLNNIVSRGGEQADSTILATEEKTSTTTIYPDEKPRNFLSKLFGRKRPAEDNSFKIISEEKVKRDTIALSAEDRMAKNLEESIRIIEKEQRKKNASFLNREAELANANSLLISQMLDVLRQVESEVVNQIEINGILAKKVVNTSITTISLIMLVFVLLTGLLLYLILTDISKSGRYRNELELARDEAEYHGQAKQRFLSNMSHEIRTPLQSIIGYSELIRHQEHPKSTDIDAIYNSSEHLLQIVNEVLDYNRIISGKFTFSNKVFDIRDLMEEVIAIMRPQAESRSLKMIADLDLQELRYVNGDPFRLKQILFNLLGNAVKFTNHGKISLSVNYKRKEDNLHFTFSVKDTGIGLSEEETKRIFNEFEQANSYDNDVVNRKGTGLGLTIIKSLVENQGGRIYVKSEEGVGSVFTVYLTFRLESEPEIENPAKLKSLSANYKVWIVDDDRLILDLCSVIFKKNHIAHKIFNSPLDLLNTVWDNDVTHVLIDMRMPEMNGIMLCRKLKEKIDGEVKIYAITAQVLPDEREHLLDNGFDGLVMKPFREAELLSALEGGNLLHERIFKSTPEVEIDLSSLKKMTFGDEEQLAKILLRFKEDSLNDIEELRRAVNENETDKLCLICHRLAGRISQIGGRSLAAEFRVYELDLRGRKQIPDKNKLFQLIEMLLKMVYSIS